MRPVYLLFVIAVWCSGQGLTEEETKKIYELFGTPSTEKDVDLSPGLKPTPASRQGEISDDEMKRLIALYGTPPPPGPPSTTRSPAVVTGNETECDLDGGQKGICVVYYLCKPNSNTINTDGETLIDIRERTCPHYLDVCCGVSETRVQPTPPPTTPPPTTTAPVPTPTATTCGWSNPGAQSFRIKGGQNEAEFGEFPWMVAVLKRMEGSTAWSQNDYLGGGSIIHPKAVLTGAHKVDGMDASQIKCRAGEYDTQTDKEQYPHQERNVQKIIKHENYYRPSVYNSVALLILEAPYDLANAPHMGVACVAPAPPAAGAPCIGMGWGADFNQKDQYAVILKKLQLPWIAREKCQNEFRHTRLGAHFVLHPSLACAGGVKGMDTCRGDGGSPLVCPLEEPGRYAIFGLVAWGLGCGEPIPGAYVNVPHLHDWITAKTRAEGLGTASYSY